MSRGVGYGRRVGADEISGLVVLFDGIASEAVFDTGIVVIEPPEGLGYGTAMWP